MTLEAVDVGCPETATLPDEMSFALVAPGGAEAAGGRGAGPMGAGGGCVDRLCQPEPSGGADNATRKFGCKFYKHNMNISIYT